MSMYMSKWRRSGLTQANHDKTDYLLCKIYILVSYWTFCCVVSPSIFTSCAVFWAILHNTNIQHDKLLCPCRWISNQSPEVQILHDTCTCFRQELFVIYAYRELYTSTVSANQWTLKRVYNTCNLEFATCNYKIKNWLSLYLETSKGFTFQSHHSKFIVSSISGLF